MNVVFLSVVLCIAAKGCLVGVAFGKENTVGDTRRIRHMTLEVSPLVLIHVRARQTTVIQFGHMSPSLGKLTDDLVLLVLRQSTGYPLKSGHVVLSLNVV